jgi:hypothetical protein
VRFEFLESAEITGEPVSVSFWLAFDTSNDYTVYFREQGSSSQSFLTLFFTDLGTILFSDENNPVPVEIGSYVVGEPFRVEVAMMMGLAATSVWVDDERLLHREVHGIQERGFGSVSFGIGNDVDLIGRMRFDNVKVFRLPDAATPVEEGPGIDTPLAMAAQILGAAPNPFNPQTTIAFALPRAGRARLEIVDARGRRIARLIDEDLSAGEHRAVWRGMDDAGRRAASGVYLARLTVDGISQGVPLTLVK